MSKNKEIQPYWRPNVRVASTLPDIKVVRTDFIVNFIAFTLVIITGVYLLQREYRTFVLNRTIATLEQQISSMEPDDKKNLELDSRFRAAAEYVVDLQSFYSSPFKPYELVSEITKAVPEDMLFTRLSLSEVVAEKTKSLTYRLNIGCEVPDLTILNAFKSTLNGLELLQPEGYNISIVESFGSKNVLTNVFPCSINIELQLPGESPKKKGKKK